MPRAISKSPLTFFGAATPPAEVVAVVPLLHALPVEALRPILQQLSALLQGTRSTLSDDQFIAVQRKMLGKLEGLELPVSWDGAMYGALFSGLHSLLRAAVRNKMPGEAIKRDLVSMNIPPAAVDDLMRVLQRVRPEIEAHAIAARIRCPRLQRLRWRVDVVISSGSLSRVMRPSLLMQMVLSNGAIKTFQVSVEQFHQLRFGVAKVLNDMQQLQRHPIMRIVQEADKKQSAERQAAL